MAVVAAGGDFVDAERGGGGEDAVEGEEDPGGERRVDAGDLEDGGDEQRVERRDPGGGTGVSAEGVGVAVAGDEGAGDAGHLVAEGEVVFEGAEAVGVGEGDVEDADEEAGPEEDDVERGRRD